MKKQTLTQFCAECGSQELAAHKIGVTVCHINRLLHGKVKRPHHLLLARLAEMGIEFKAEKK